MLDLTQKKLINEQFSGQIEGEFLHRCPVCGRTSQCQTDDNYHNCNMCGSTWHTWQ